MLIWSRKGRAAAGALAVTLFAGVFLLPLAVTWAVWAACTKPKPPLPRIPIYKKNAGRTFRKGEGSACFFAPLPHFSLRRKCATIALA